MTEIELNEQLAALLENPEKEPNYPRRTGRRYRRRKGQEKTNRRLAITQLSGYAPRRGYVDWGFEGKTLLHTGKYIKYPQNSKCQRWFKRVSRKKVRACPNLPPKEERPPQGFRLLVGTVLRETAVSRKNVMRRIFIISLVGGAVPSCFSSCSINRKKYSSCLSVNFE